MRSISGRVRTKRESTNLGHVLRHEFVGLRSHVRVHKGCEVQERVPIETELLVNDLVGRVGRRSYARDLVLGERSRVVQRSSRGVVRVLTNHERSDRLAGVLRSVLLGRREDLVRVEMA